MLIGSLVFAGVMFTVGVFLWCKNGIKRNYNNDYIDEI